ncbi:MAG: hypothetical protein IIC72_12000 [Acidobacteria bacterium]|nr:hypothetical protein [Acidobacteriota bacterium]
MKDQVEYRRPDLFRTTHTYLDSNLAINSAVDLARASVRAEGEHHIIGGAEPPPNLLTR